MIAPNIAAPTENEATVAAEKVRPSKSSSGRIGAPVCRSQRTKAVAETAATRKRPMMIGEPHGYCVPPQTAARRPAAALAGGGRGPTAAVGRVPGGGEAAGGRRGRAVVERVLLGRGAANEPEPDDNESDRRERKVDEEAPAPRPVV